MATITEKDMFTTLKGLNGPFECTFVKVSDGSTRVMQCQKGLSDPTVTAEGHEKRLLEDVSNNVLTVVDLEAYKKTNDLRSSYRRININGIVQIKFNDEVYSYDTENKIFIKD